MLRASRPIKSQWRPRDQTAGLYATGPSPWDNRPILSRWLSRGQGEGLGSQQASERQGQLRASRPINSQWLPRGPPPSRWLPGGLLVCLSTVGSWWATWAIHSQWVPKGLPADLFLTVVLITDREAHPQPVTILGATPRPLHGDPHHGPVGLFLPNDYTGAGQQASSWGDLHYGLVGLSTASDFPGDSQPASPQSVAIEGASWPIRGQWPYKWPVGLSTFSGHIRGQLAYPRSMAIYGASWSIHGQWPYCQLAYPRSVAI